MILLIDNYDSFSYNLVQACGKITQEITVVRNDQMTLSEITTLNPSHLIISPGPGFPADAGISEAVIAQFKKQIPILGVCLGHQAICEVFGAKITHAKHLMHGKQSAIEIDNQLNLFKRLPKVIKGARYHSLVADPQTMPAELDVIARETANGEIMAVKHREFPLFGLQFHPESILTPDGETMITNFLKITN